MWRNLLLGTLIVVLFASMSAATTSQRAKNPRPTGRSKAKATAGKRRVQKVVLPLPNGKIAKVYYGESVRYVLSPVPQERMTRLDDGGERAHGGLAIRIGDGLALDNLYVKLPGGKRGKFILESSNPVVATIVSDAPREDYSLSHPGDITFLSPGRAQFTVSIGASSARISVNVVRVPIWHSMSKDEVMAVLGMPDRTNKGWISWPEDKVVDGLYYSTSGSAYGTAYEHWFYKAYPGAVFRFEDDKLWCISQPGWDEDVASIKFALENGRVKAVRELTGE